MRQPGWLAARQADSKAARWAGWQAGSQPDWHFSSEEVTVGNY